MAVVRVRAPFLVLLILILQGLILQGGSVSEGAILSSKRGFADFNAGYDNLQATGAGWYHTWQPGVGFPGDFDAQHIPMFRDWTPIQSTINSIKSRPNVEWVMGFNEPERTDQDDMTVSQAISAWTQITNGFAGTGIKLVSPAVSDTSEGRSWMTDFRNQVVANGLQVDAVAFHWYGWSNPNNIQQAANNFMASVNWYHNLWNKPVFISEFAIHDWGGAYTDEEISEANRQFLDLVIPQLESTSWVEGYAWYHWFGDAHLYEGNPFTPTAMGYKYVGALQSGESEDVGGREFGRHVAYLAGGTLSVTGSAPTGLHYLNALESTSDLDGNVDWGFTRNDWVRVQAGATLRKIGSNTVSFNCPVNKMGGLEVAEGGLELFGVVQGSGNIVVSGGILKLAGAANVDQTPHIDVRSGGTLDISGGLEEYDLVSGQTLEARQGSTVLGNLTTQSGSMIQAAGTFANDLTIRSGATLQVGEAGLAIPTRFLIDNFEGYSTGNVRDVASPPWTAHQNTSLADIEDYSGNRVLTYGWADDFRGASRDVPEETVLGDGNQATIFFRVNSKTAGPNHNLGVGDQADVNAVNFGDYEAQVRLKTGSANTFDVDARNGNSFSATLASGLSLNTWYNFWLVIDQASDTYDVYMNTGTGDATGANKLNATPLNFRNGTASDLYKFLALAGGAPIDNGVRVDDIYYFAGADLYNPLAGFDAGSTLTPGLLTVAGDLVQQTGGLMTMDIFSASVHDQIEVGGLFTAGGTLNVALEAGAPAPEVGDTFALFSFSSAAGAFDEFQLPTLASGLAWNVSNLLLTGELQVVTDVDLDDDGWVTGSDFLLIQRINPALVADWQALYGSQLVSAAGGFLTSAATVPEPTACTYLLLLLGIGVTSRKSSFLV